MEKTAKGLHIRIKKRINFKPYNHLDIGSGSGCFIKSLKTINKRVGIDKETPESIIGYRFIKGDIEKKLPKGKYDLITCMEVIEHINAPLLLMQKIFKNLTDGGTAIITTPKTDSIPSKISFLIKNKLINFYNKDKEHITPIIPNIFEREIKKIGFEIIHKEVHKRGFAHIQIWELTR